MSFENNQFMEEQIRNLQAQQGQQISSGQQFLQGQVNNYVNHTTTVGNVQAVENTNYYDTYHHRINNYHTMNTNRYKDHYIEHNVYYNHTRNVYDGTDYHTTNDFVTESRETENNTQSNYGKGRRYPGCGCNYTR